MKNIIIFLSIVLITITVYAGDQKMIPRYNRLTQGWAAYPEVTIAQIQQVPFDSLLLADTLQNTLTSKWTLQMSPYAGDTVVITALVIAPAKVITYTQRGYSMLLYDTSAAGAWRGLFVRCSSDTATHIADGFMNPERGDIIQITGLVGEFPTSPLTMNSGTQFQPIPGIAIDIVGSMTVPAPVAKSAGDFYTGIFSGGKTWYSTGEPMEGMVVELINLTVDARVNASRGTFSAVDESGNQITMYDASRYFTLQGTSADHPYPDPLWQVEYPLVGAKIDTIRGFITVASGSENARGYRIAPLYYGDIVFGSILPNVTTHRRYPIVVPPDSTPIITCRAYAQASNTDIQSVILYYSVDNGSFIPDTMVFEPADSTYRGTIPQQTENSIVRYFIQATDSLANSKILASSALGGASSDTSKGFFFYTVLNRSITIYDVQYTPFLNGRTPYLGAVVSISGIVTADTAHLQTTVPSSGWTTAWYMQNGNQPWNGIWITGPESLMIGLKNGDSITVTGSVAEQFDVTRIQFISSVVVHSSGNPLPEPVGLNSGDFGPTAGNGSPLAEPYEGMLIKFTNVTVTDVYPTFADPSEYNIDDGSGPVLVQQGGKNNYSNIPNDTTLGKTILYVGDRISSLTGIMYFSFNRYKFVPRANDDFGTVTGVGGENGITVPAGFNVSQNYPNPFNPVTKFDIDLPQGSNLEVTVYNLLGQKIATLVNGYRTAGSHNVMWNGTNERGMAVNTGVYFVRVQGDRFSTVRKIMLVK